VLQKSNFSSLQTSLTEEATNKESLRSFINTPPCFLLPQVFKSFDAASDMVGRYYVEASSLGSPTFWDGSSKFLHIEPQTFPRILFIIITVLTGINKWCQRKMNLSSTIPK
jgi:hypothetical protein